MTVYVIDTSALIHALRHYPPDVFPSLWRDLERLAKDEQLRAPWQVYDEVMNGSDWLVGWMKTIKSRLVVRVSAAVLREVVLQHPELLDPGKGAADADAAVVALALEINGAQQCTLSLDCAFGVCVVTEEKRTASPKKIPAACDAHGLPCTGLLEMLRREKLSY